MIDKAVRRAEPLLTKQFNISCKIYQAKCEDVTKCVNGDMQQLSTSLTKKTVIQWLMTSNSTWLRSSNISQQHLTFQVIPVSEARLLLLKKVGFFSVFEGTWHNTAHIYRAKPSSSPKQLHSRVTTSELLTGNNNLILSNELCTGISWERAVLLRPYLWQELFNTMGSWGLEHHPEPSPFSICWHRCSQGGWSFAVNLEPDKTVFDRWLWHFLSNSSDTTPIVVDFRKF